MKLSSRNLIGYIFIVSLVLGSLFSFWQFNLIHIKQKSILNGDYARFFERQMAQSLWYQDLSVNLSKFIKYKLFNEGVDGVVLGKDGWIFTAEEFEIASQEHLRNNLEYILNVQKSLLDRNVDLLILPVPSKVRIYQSKLEAKTYPDDRKNIYPDFIKFLNNNNFQYLDIAKIFVDKKSLYFKTDTHWTQKATALVARETANFPNINNEVIDFKLENSGQENFSGDLLQYVWNDGYDQEIFSVVQAVSDQETELFKEQYFPIVLVGTSYSADPRWGFETALKYFLKQDVLNLSDKGLGPFAVMKQYLKNLNETNKMPELIIWEIPERYLGAEI
jgi:alginate O-acetyltransferase complex protein AlgJ